VTGVRQDLGVAGPNRNLSQWQVGDATVTSIVEAETPGIPPQFFFPDATHDDVRACEGLDGFAAADGTVALAVQAFLVELPGYVALIDPCVGDHKDRSLPFWHQQSWGGLAKFAETGVAPEDVDLVVHTHLHADHVGWDTAHDGEEWLPTFTNATYVYVDEEVEYWKAAEQRTEEDVYGDAVAPVFEHGLGEVVDARAELGHGLRLVPTPGHTPGHVSVELVSAGDLLLVTGDLVHHPVQFARPEWAEIGDYDAALARETRRGFMDEHARRGTVLAGTHFPFVPVGRAEPDAGAWRFEPIAPRSV
jgi:glyoxylase-like metal-dependent hydrolase (beta-lactamase superfamily II)